MTPMQQLLLVAMAALQMTPLCAVVEDHGSSADILSLDQDQNDLKQVLKMAVGGDQLRSLMVGSQTSAERARTQEGMSLGALPSIAEAAVRTATQPEPQETLISDGTLGEEVDAKLDYTYSNTNWDKWPLCRQGSKQSPIDLQRPFYGAFLKLQLNYTDQSWPVQENDGRVMRVAFKEGDGSFLGVGDKQFTPTEAIFHSPSEHTLQGKRFDMEMQIMHKDTVGNMAGISVFMESSDKIPKDNFYVQNVFSHFFTNLPKSNNKKRIESLNLKWILNEKMIKHYITYHGSLSHPPCSEGVEWFVLGRPWLLEKKWVEAFKKAVTMPNIRPLQPKGKRMMYSF